MARCPKFLKPDDFDALARSIGCTLTDQGVSILGEAVEHIARDIMLHAQRSVGAGRALSRKAILESAESLGISVKADSRSGEAIQVKVGFPTSVNVLD